MEIEFLKNGQIKSTTSKISAANHQAAEGFLKLLAQLTGGPTTRTPRGDHEHHTSTHTHTHEHEHGA